MSSSFIHDDFLLQTPTARRLYHEHAAPQPIIDYHCHLSPKEIAENRRFKNLYEIWLEGDHYKWRAMRTNGVHESLCTGNAAPFEKYMAWAETVPKTLRNPLYHWSHLELKRLFGIDELLNPYTALAIWEETERQLAAPAFSATGILNTFRVEIVGTTDDPADDLCHHQAIATQGLKTRVVPTFRPDKALNVHQPAAWNAWVDRLAQVAETSIHALDDLLGALKKRHEDFHNLGGRMSDHGLERCFALFASEKEVANIFTRARAGQTITLEEREKFATFVMLEVGRWNAARGWTMQLHLGAKRNNNSRLFAELGPDTGFDSIGDFPQVETLSAFLDRLDQEKALPRTILYNLNPADNYAFATMLGNFQDGSVAGKLQLGSGWWFLDQKEAMEWQLSALSHLGLLSRFIGMLTDSRSFMSYPRHEYFRRILCNLLGNDVEQGLLPNDATLIGSLVEDICYNNAHSYF